jgi:hypothetical protein
LIPLHDRVGRSAAILLLLIGAFINNSFAAPGHLDKSFDPAHVVR